MKHEEIAPKPEFKQGQVWRDPMTGLRYLAVEKPGLDDFGITFVCWNEKIFIGRNPDKRDVRDRLEYVGEAEIGVKSSVHKRAGL